MMKKENNTISEILNRKGIAFTKSSICVLALHSKIGGKSIFGKHPAVSFSEYDLRGCKRKIAMLRERILRQIKAGMCPSFGEGQLKPKLP